MVERLVKCERKRRKDRSLSEELEHELQQVIFNKRPFQVEIKPEGPYFQQLYLWNRDAVMHLINRRLKQPLSIPCIAKYLDRWGFPRMDHNQQPIDRCASEIKEWLEMNYKELERRAQAEKAAIYWICKRQMSSVADEKFKGQRNNWMVSATDIRGKEHWLHVKGAYTEKHQLSFLKALANQSRQRLFLIRDVTEYYTSSDVMYWLCKNKDKIDISTHVGNINFQEVETRRKWPNPFAILRKTVTVH
jgi:hypothetical protein